ncbi:MAG: transcriptional regulator TbsP [Haloquadratum sp.]
MSAETNVLGDDVERVISSALQSTAEVVYVVDPTVEIIESIVDIGIGDASLPTTKVLARKSLLKDALDDFLVASNAADLVQAGALELRTMAHAVENTLFIGDDAVIAVVTAGDRIAGLATDDEAFVRDATDAYRRHFEEGEEFSLRTPPLSRVRSSLEDGLGPQVRDDFDAVLDSLQAVQGDGGGLDEVEISLLVAARNDLLLYDVSKWGEDVGIASKATFSRTKTELEDRGLIETEKVPIDVGRPRLRLKLGDDRLAEAEPADLADVAIDLRG